MIHWFVIILGIIILSSSISSPFYKLTLMKLVKIKNIPTILLRIFLFFLGILIIFLGLYIESKI